MSKSRDKRIKIQMGTDDDSIPMRIWTDDWGGDISGGTNFVRENLFMDMQTRLTNIDTMLSILLDELYGVPCDKCGKRECGWLDEACRECGKKEESEDELL